MGIENLTAIVAADGTVKLACGICGASPPREMYGAQNREQLAYIIDCPKCQRILGEWLTKGERARDLKAFAEKAIADARRER